MPPRRSKRSSRRTHDPAAVRRKIIPARDATPIKSALFYARNKVGKTTLCASAGEVGKTLIIDPEEGTSSIRNSRNVEVYKLTAYEEIDEIYWYLANQKHSYQFVCIDPMTALQEQCLAHVLREKASLDLASDPYTPEQRDWQKTSQLMRKVITEYKALPNLFVIFTAYERLRENEDEDAESSIVIGPDSMPSVKGHLMGKVDVIGRLYVHPIETEEGRRRIERRMLFGSHAVYEAGDRSGNLPRVMREPTMKKILDRINGGN